MRAQRPGSSSGQSHYNVKTLNSCRQFYLQFSLSSFPKAQREQNCEGVRNNNEQGEEVGHKMNGFLSSPSPPPSPTPPSFVHPLPTSLHFLLTPGALACIARSLTRSTRMENGRKMSAMQATSIRSSLTSFQCQRWSKQCHEQVQSLQYNE